MIPQLSILPGIDEIDPGLCCLHVYQVLGKTFQFWLKLNNQFDCRTRIDIVVVGLRGGLETAQNCASVRVGAVNDDYLSMAMTIP